MPRTSAAKVAKNGAPAALAAEDTRDRLAAMAAVAEKIPGYRPAREVLTRVRGVRTIFPQLDEATRIGAWPIDRISVIHGPSNHGKALAIETPVLTPTGTSPIGQIAIGDRVIGADGQPCRVIGVFPQGLKQLFAVRFSDGEELECCDEHLWFTTTNRERRRGKYVRGPRPDRARIPTGTMGSGSVKSLAQIRAHLRSGDHAIPLCGPIDFDPVGDLPIHPYVMGLLLGDGSLSKSTIGFSKPEKDVSDRLAALLPAGDRLTNVGEGEWLIVGADRCGSATAREIGRMGLKGLRSHEKFVPSVYLFATVAERLDLIRGLLDTDGHVTKEGCEIEFSSTSIGLVTAVVDLARGLGAIVRVGDPFEPRYVYRGEHRTGKPARRVWIRFLNGLIPVSSIKHLRAYRPRRRAAYRTIVSVEQSRVGEAVCIAVDSPDRLYVVAGHVVTHNTEFLLGLGKSFLDAGHFFKLVDAEFTTPIDWLAQLGMPLDHPGFSACRPTSYEETVDVVQRWAEAIGEAKAKGVLPPDMTGLAGIDSLKKLVPKALLSRLMKEAADSDDEPKQGQRRRSKRGLDGMNGAAARFKAALNNQWMDSLVPLLAQTGTAVALIAREYEKQDDDDFLTRDEDYVIGGGRGPVFDASIRARVILEGEIWEGEGSSRRTVGQRHRVEIRKTKIGKKEARVPSALFHTSNGKLVPEGFDGPRDHLDLAKDMGLVEVRGSYYWHGRTKLGQGESAAVVRLHKDHAAYEALAADVRGIIEQRIATERSSRGLA